MEMQYKGYNLETEGDYFLAKLDEWPCVATKVRELESPARGVAYWKITPARLKTADDEGLSQEDILMLNIPKTGAIPHAVRFVTYRPQKGRKRI